MKHEVYREVKNMKILSIIPALVLGLLALTSCGGGGGGAAPANTTRTLTLSAAGTTALIAGIQAVIILPAGVTLNAASGTVPGSVLQPSGGAAGALATGNYTPASASAAGMVRVALISSSGFAAGEFLTVQCVLAPGAAPLDTDFALQLESVIDPQTKPLTGVTLGAKLGS